MRVSLTMRGLVAEHQLGLTARAGADFLDVAVTWVHTSELSDPTPFLEGGELLLTTGMSLPAERDAFIERLVECGISGLGFGVGVNHRRIPDDLVAAAERNGLPLLEVPRPTPFIAISKAVSRAVAAEEYAGVSRVNQAQRELSHAAGRPSGRAALVQKLRELLGSWVLVLDPVGNRVCGEPERHTEVDPRLRAEAAALGRKEGLAAAGCTLDGDEVSLRTVGRRTQGFLAVGRGSAFTAEDHHVINAAASLLTLVLAQGAVLDEARSQVCSAALELLLHGTAVHELLGYLGEQPPASTVRVVVLNVEHVSEIGPVLSELRRDRPSAALFLAQHAGDVVALVAEGSDRELSWLLGRIPVSAGISNACEVDALATGMWQAQQANRAAAAGDVVCFSDLAGGGILGMVSEGTAAVFAESLLAPLRAEPTLLTSLQVWLRHNGQSDPAANKLGVHRHTLRNRVRKAAGLLDRDLDQPGVRAELWIALQVVSQSSE